MKTTTETILTLQLHAVSAGLRTWTTQVWDMDSPRKSVYEAAKRELLKFAREEQACNRPLLHAYLASDIDEPRVMTMQQLLDWDPSADDARWAKIRSQNLARRREEFESRRGR